MHINEYNNISSIQFVSKIFSCTSTMSCWEQTLPHAVYMYCITLGHVINIFIALDYNDIFDLYYVR